VENKYLLSLLLLLFFLPGDASEWPPYPPCSSPPWRGHPPTASSDPHYSASHESIHPRSDIKS